MPQDFCLKSAFNILVMMILSYMWRIRTKMLENAITTIRSTNSI